MKQTLENYLETNNISQNQFAKKIGLSGALISQYLSGKYAGDIDTLEARIRAFLNRSKEKTINLNFSFIETTSASRMLETIKYAHIEEEINVIVGGAGLGKTYVLQEYAKQNKEVILIYSTPALSVKGLLVNICNQLQLEEKGATPVLFDRIVNKLRGTGRLILIDEAENLTVKGLEILRRIHDFTEVGLVLAGTPELLKNLLGRKKELRQLYSRVGLLCDIGFNLDDEDIAKIATGYLQTDALNASLVKFAKGSARRLKKLVKGAVRAANLNKVEVTGKIIEQVSSLLIN